MARGYYNGQIDLLIPDGTPVPAGCDAGYRHGRWEGTVSLGDTERRVEQGDVCHVRLNGEDLRIIITGQVGSKRFSFIALIKPDPYESL